MSKKVYVVHRTYLDGSGYNPDTIIGVYRTKAAAIEGIRENARLEVNYFLDRRSTDEDEDEDEIDAIKALEELEKNINHYQIATSMDKAALKSSEGQIYYSQYGQGIDWIFIEDERYLITQMLFSNK